jgi:hypothetical protein
VVPSACLRQMGFVQVPEQPPLLDVSLSNGTRMRCARRNEAVEVVGILPERSFEKRGF